MNKSIWSVITIWGFIVTCFGLGAMNPANIADAASAQEAAIFLLAGGIVTFLIGLTGLINSLGWIPNSNENLTQAHAIPG